MDRTVLKQFARWVTATPIRLSLLRYLLSVLAVFAAACLLPEETLGDNRGLIAFFAIVACAWFAGFGPGVLSLIVLVLIFRHRTKGSLDLQGFTVKELRQIGVLSVLIGSIGWAGTLRRRSQRIARQRESELRELHHRKDAFLATLAHELRNPLAPLRSGLEVLRLAAERPGGAIDAADVRKMMQRQVEHMVRLIDDLLEVSRINTGKIELLLANADLADIIRNAVEASRPHITSARHELAVAYPEAAIVLKIDSARITQVLTNLLNNAAKFTAPGGRIAISSRIDGERLRISVSDSGIGIEPEMLPRIFEMFVQAPSLLERGHGGLGIGLSLSRAIIELHGGTLEAFSQGTGKGSQFIATLPGSTIVSVEKRNDADVANDGPPGEHGRRVMIVDDNVNAAHSLAMVLSAEGYHCHSVNDGHAALNVAPMFNPDIFVLDIGMPGMNGHELAQQLRAMPQFRHCMLIAVTGWGKEEDRRQSKAAGFDYHLVKPVSALALQELLTQSKPVPV